MSGPCGEEGECARGRSESNRSNTSQLSDYDPEALTRRLRSTRLNPFDILHITSGELENSQEEECDLAHAQAAVKNLPPPCKDHFGHEVTLKPEAVRVYDFSGRPVTDQPEPVQVYDYSTVGQPEIHTPEHRQQDVPLHQRMQIYCSHTFCSSCQNPYAQLNEARAAPAEARGGGTFDWDGHDSDLQPMVINEPGDWAPDASEPQGRCSIQ